MAVLETLRTKFGMAVTILVALGLLSFIIDPSSLETAYHAMSSKYDVGEIDGKSISYNDFQAEMDHYKDISQLLSGSSAESSQQQAQIRNMAWQSLLDRHLFIKNAKEAGINVGTDEMVALTSGDLISPVIAQDPVFADETGNFSKDRLLQFVQGTSSDSGAKMYWDYIQNNIYTQQFYAKYGSLFSDSNFKSPLMRRRLIEENNNTVDIDFVMVPMNPYEQDTTVTVSSEEIKAFYNAHKDFFKQQESRDIEYVVFEVKPSEADIQATSDNFNKLYEEFGTTDNVKSFLAKNSDRVLSNYWYKAGELATINSDINNYVFDKPEGVSPVFRSGNTFYAVKVMDTALLPDSVYVKHILLQGDGADKRADSLVTVLGKGGDFAALANLYSVDKGSSADGEMGNIGWMTQSYMIPGFEDIFSRKPGVPFTLKTQYGWHVVEVSKITAPVQKKQVAIFEKATVSSKETFNSFYSTANDFATRASAGYDAYKAAADSMHVYSHPLNNVLETNESYGSISDARELTRWIFDNKKGKVSGIITVNNNYFFVTTIKDIHKEGLATVAEAAPQIRQQLHAEKSALKKAEDVAAKISGLTDLQSIAEALGTTVNSQSGITFASLMSQGLDPKLIGAVSVAPIGEISKPVAGSIATYVYQVKSRDTGSFFTEDDAKAYDDRMNNYLQQMVLPVMSQEAQVVDHRAKFY